MRDDVILVDMKDTPIGHMEKLEAHVQGQLHRAFSVFLFNGDKLLLQRRAESKYHCGGLWTNTCCSHPRDGESVTQAAIRRLREELGIEDVVLQESGEFVYRCCCGNGLIEFEFDHVLTGEYSGTCRANPDEVDSVSWVTLPEVMEDVRLKPEKYTPWFITALGLAVNGRSRQ